MKMAGEVVEAGGWIATIAALASKVLPPAVGAGLMCAVDKPETKREMFLRAFVAFGFTYLFRGVAKTLAAKYVPGFDATDEEHMIALYGALGASGWFILGAAVTIMRKFREDPWSLLPAFMQRKP